MSTRIPMIAPATAPPRATPWISGLERNLPVRRPCPAGRPTSVSGTQQEAWSLDSLGNNLAAGTYSAANEETSHGRPPSGYDLAGNMTTLQNGDTATYDAWDRLAKVLSNSTIVQKNEYDGTNRRIQIFSNFTGGTPGTTEDDYLSGQQVIETRENSAVKYQQIWSPRYIDSAILRDTYSSGSIVQAARVFYLSDANYNVTGLVKYDSQSQTWGVAERYTYTPYGVVTYRNADWTTATSSANLNTTLYTGRTLDLLISIYYYRGRYYDQLLERFIGRDPFGYYAGIDLYDYVRNAPTNRTDPLGLQGSGQPGEADGKCQEPLLPGFTMPPIKWGQPPGGGYPSLFPALTTPPLLADDPFAGWDHLPNLDGNYFAWVGRPIVWYRPGFHLLPEPVLPPLEWEQEPSGYEPWVWSALTGWPTAVPTAGLQLPEDWWYTVMLTSPDWILETMPYLSEYQLKPPDEPYADVASLVRPYLPIRPRPPEGGPAPIWYPPNIPGMSGAQQGRSVVLFPEAGIGAWESGLPAFQAVIG